MTHYNIQLFSILICFPNDLTILSTFSHTTAIFYSFFILLNLVIFTLLTFVCFVIGNIRPEEEEKLQSLAAQALSKLRKLQERMGDKNG